MIIKLLTKWTSIFLYITVNGAKLSLPESISLVSPMSNLESNPNAIAEFFPQLIDHNSNQTFSQRHYINDTFYKSGGPALLLVGGEAVNSPLSVSSTFANELARRYNGILFSLEHRYYGVSHPYNDTSVDSLKFLSSDYALKDINRFAKAVINPKTGLTESKWIVLGYSYSGMLAAWSRQMDPDLFIGALASSAPVHAKEDFYEYDQMVQEALGNTCADKIEKIVKRIDDIYTSNSTRFSAIKQQLGCEKLDDIFFISTLADIISHVVQYNKSTGNVTIGYLCQNLSENQVDLLVNQFISTSVDLLKNMKETCYSFAGSDQLKDTAIKESSGTRQWTYQCCTEFGYWQTAPQSSRYLRSRLLTVDWFNQFYCSKNFYSKPIGPPNTNQINQFHQGRNIETDRIIFTNGDKDPWAKLSVSNPELSRPDRPVIIINGGSHTSDYQKPKSSNSKSLSEAYETIINTFNTWLN